MFLLYARARRTVSLSVSKGDGEEDRMSWQGDPDFPEAVYKISHPRRVPGSGDCDVTCMIEILGQLCSQTDLRARKNEKGREQWCGLEHKGQPISWGGWRRQEQCRPMKGESEGS